MHSLAQLSRDRGEEKEGGDAEMLLYSFVRKYCVADFLYGKADV